MKMTLAEAFDMIDHGENAEQYKKRMAKIRRLANERDALEAGIAVLKDDTEPIYVERRQKKEKRLAKVLQMIEELK